MAVVKKVGRRYLITMASRDKKTWQHKTRYLVKWSTGTKAYLFIGKHGLIDVPTELAGKWVELEVKVIKNEKEEDKTN